MKDRDPGCEAARHMSQRHESGTGPRGHRNYARSMEGGPGAGSGHGAGARKSGKGGKRGHTTPARRSSTLLSPVRPLGLREPGLRESVRAPGSFQPRRDPLEGDAAEVLAGELITLARDVLTRHLRQGAEAHETNITRTHAALHDRLEELGVRHRARREAIIETLVQQGILKRAGGKGWQARYLAAA